MPRQTAVKHVLPQTTKEKLLEEFKDYAGINVIERRFANPNDPGSLPILLKDEADTCCMSTGHQSKVLSRSQTTCREKLPSGARCGLPVRHWHIYIIDTTADGRWAQMKTKGYVPVLVEELKDTEDVTALVRQKEDNGAVYARRGDRGKEIVMKIPLPLYNQIKADQLTRVNAGLTSKKKLQAELSEGAGRELGDEAGQTIHNGGIQVESLSRSRSTLADEAE
jgi:hypothetical protein